MSRPQLIKWTLLSTLIFIIGPGCTFVSRRIEAREQKEYADKTGRPQQTTDEQWTHVQIQNYERGLKTRREKEHYSKLLPWFRNEDEKLEYLSLGSMREKIEWANDKKIWNRARSPNDEMKSLMQSQDIAIGMPMEYVLKAWGDPISRQTSGNPLFKNEKWRYERSVPTQEGFKKEVRIVYFEGGKVVGWETD